MVDQLSDLLNSAADRELVDTHLKPPWVAESEGRDLHRAQNVVVDTTQLTSSEPSSHLWAGVAAAAVVIAIAAGALLLSGSVNSTQPVSGVGAGPGKEMADPLAPNTNPHQRLQEAVDATLASDSFRVEAEMVLPGDGELVSMVETYRSPGLLAFSWEHNGDTPINEVYDETSGLLYWLEADGDWRRALVAGAGGIRDSLGDLTTSQCVIAENASTLVAYTGSALDCTSPASSDPRWVIRLRTDGRIESTAPMGDHGSEGPNLEHRFVAFDESVALEVFATFDEAGVLENPDSSIEADEHPFGSGSDARLGYVTKYFTHHTPSDPG